MASKAVPARSFGAVFAGAFSQEHTIHVVVSRGREEVLAWTEALERLTAETGQDGAALGLRYVLEEEFASRKIPYLVCLLASNLPLHEGLDEELIGAVLLFEYRIGGFGGQFRTGLIATGDSFGVRTVFGAEPFRGEIAAAAVQALLGRGARMVLVSWKREPDAPRLILPPMGGAAYQWVLASREVQDSMMLGGSLEETLASLGKRTRTGLRAARRRFDATVSCVFVQDAIGLLPFEEDDFMERLNGESLEPIEQATFNLQLRATARQTGGFVCGLRSVEHGWMALVGGWRQGETTWVEWQVNQGGFERLSLGSVLRSYLLEEEVRRGTRRLGFHGSTSHSMAHSFRRDTVADILGRRRGLLVSLLIWLVPLVLGRLNAMARRGNFLADALNRRGLEWTRADPPKG